MDNQTVSENDDKYCHHPLFARHAVRAKLRWLLSLDAMRCQEYVRCDLGPRLFCLLSRANYLLDDLQGRGLIYSDLS